jgi:hypothetical protein
MIPPLMSSTMSSEDLLGKKGQDGNAKVQDKSEEGSKGGRPEKDDTAKSDKTLKNKESMS